MGVQVSKIVEEEEVNWVRQQELRSQQLNLLQNFGEELKTCYQDNSMCTGMSLMVPRLWNLVVEKFLMQV